MRIDGAKHNQLMQWHNEVMERYAAIKQQKLSLDLTRGKPCTEQMALADSLDGILGGSYVIDGTDVRNYGGLLGLPANRRLGAEILGLDPDEVMAGGNSSLNLMHYAVLFAWLFGPDKAGSAWQKEGKVKFLCPVPGYDRHFAICEQLGIEMIPVAMNDHGPDMDQVESLLRTDRLIKGMWCVPKYSNPSGCVYSQETVDRIARLGTFASNNFRVFWDNAYAVHDLTEDAPMLASIMAACKRHGTEDSVLQFTSTSKITFAGAGVAFLGASKSNLAVFSEQLGIATIGPDKVNQARHAKFLPDLAALKIHMRKHAALIKPRFDVVLDLLDRELADSDLGEWSRPQGGYFISFNTRPGLAARVVKLADEAGVKLTPAGATFPGKKDPADSNIRIAPTFPSLADLEKAMDVFVVCVKLASLEQKLSS